MESPVTSHRPGLRAAAIFLAVALLALLLPATALADAVIGTGTAASCTSQQAANDLSNAVAAGGTITFNCGPAMVTIAANTNATDKTVVVNGGGKVTLSGENLRQIFFVFGSGNVTLNDLVLVDGDASQGGAIYVDTQATVTVNNSYLVSNGANVTSGGTIYNRGSLNLINVEVGASNASANGGAIYNAGGALTLNRVTLRNNEAGQQGGGVYSSGGTVAITNSTIGENRAQGGGGLFLTGDGTNTLLNVTFALNRAGTGGALWNFSGVTSVKNSIFAQSLQSDGVTPTLNCDGTAMTSQGRNIVDDGSCIPASANDKRNTDAKLGGFDLNGGIGATFLPLADSPALDYAQGCPLTDQRGYPRPLGPGCDVGAIERGALLFLPVMRK